MRCVLSVIICAKDYVQRCLADHVGVRLPSMCFALSVSLRTVRIATANENPGSSSRGPRWTAAKNSTVAKDVLFWECHRLGRACSSLYMASGTTSRTLQRVNCMPCTVAVDHIVVRVCLTLAGTMVMTN